MSDPICVFWFRRDLRLNDNAGLFHALNSGLPVLPVFLFDTDILNDLEDKADKRVHFIHGALEILQRQIIENGSSLLVMHGRPYDCFTQLAEKYSVASVYTNHDYEPYALKRDAEVEALLRKRNIALHTFKDQVVFEKSEVVKDNGEPYTVFTPYSRKWKANLSAISLPRYDTQKLLSKLLPSKEHPLPSLRSLGFREAPADVVPARLDEDIARHYDKTRDTPAIQGTSRLGVHLRFGTVSIRQLVKQAMALNPAFLSELIWREFYQAIIWHFPYVVNGAFRKEYDRIVWRNNEKEFELWCTGQTGFPIVDAGMRELNATGFMHNRVRMIAASFLAKDLLIDWRRGEAYFASKLLDFELAANNGNWQWAAGTGCDAAPYFRVFNPTLQAQKFDPDLRYIRKWIPELDTFDYPQPIVDHAAAKERCLAAYKGALNR